MALKNCKECGEKVSTKAKTCPSCGAKAPKKTSFVTWLVLVLFVVGIFSTIGTPPSPDSNTLEPSQTQATAQQASLEPTPEPVAPPSSWRTTTSTDTMSGDQTSYASSIRVAPLQRMSFPYNDVMAWLGMGCDGTNEWVYAGFSDSPNLSGDETQDGYNSIRTRIKWDDSEPEFVNMTQDWGSDFLHFQTDGVVISKINESSKALLEINWYGEGNVYFEFPLNGSSAAISEIRSLCSGY